MLNVQLVQLYIFEACLGGGRQALILYRGYLRMAEVDFLGSKPAFVRRLHFFAVQRLGFASTYPNISYHTLWIYPTPTMLVVKKKDDKSLFFSGSFCRGAVNMFHVILLVARNPHPGGVCEQQSQCIQEVN